MKQNSNAIALLDRIQLALTVVIVVATFTRHQRPIDAEHAYNAAGYRILVLLICMLGTIVVQLIKYVIKRNMPPTNANDTAPIHYQPMPGSREINITCYSTRAAHWRCNLYVIWHSPAILITFGIFGVIVSSALASLAYSLNPMLALITIPLSVAAGIAAVVIFLLGVLWFDIEKRFPAADTIRVCTSILTAEGFYDIMPEKTCFIPWSGVVSLREHNGDLYIWSSSIAGSFTPREAFRDLAIARQFYQDAAGLWKSNGTVWPGGPPGQP